jgi:hypothetical protein
MTVSLELMDVDSGNLVGSYATVEDALRVIRVAYAEFGAPGAEGLALLLVREDGTQQLIAEDFDLVRLALGHQLAGRAS